LPSSSPRERPLDSNCPDDCQASLLASIGDQALGHFRLRSWARENGHEVKDRGKVSASIREAPAAGQAQNVTVVTEASNRRSSNASMLCVPL
jgi:hypothetical protein